VHYSRITDRHELDSLIAFHNSQNVPIALDTETTGLDPFSDRITDFILTGRTTDSAVMCPASLLGAVSLLSCPLVLHNFKFDFRMLLAAGVDLRGREFQDTMLMHHLVDENASHSLDAIVQDYYQDTYKEDFWNAHKTFQDATAESQLEYACKDAIYTLRLYYDLSEALQGREKLVEHVHRLARALHATEVLGIAVDVPYMQALGEKLGERIEILKREMRATCEVACQMVELNEWSKKIAAYKTDKGKAGVPKPEFSFDSSKQLISLLYSELRLPAQKNEKTKSVSVDWDSLEALKGKHPAIDKIQEYRGHQKVYGTYIEGTFERLRKGRIYPSFNVNGTVTGRISHSAPNLAQLPRDGGVRGIYVPDPGRVLISRDFSSLEVVIEANLTKDKNLVKICREGVSKHDITAAELKIDRQAAKTLNFAMQYWCTPFKVAKLLDISKGEAELVWAKFWDVYSGPKKLKAFTDKCVVEGKPIESLFGRRRHFDARPRGENDGDFRQAYNFIVQSPGADLTSRAFYLMAEWLGEMKYGRALWSIHDELLVEAKIEHAQEVDHRLGWQMTEVGNEIGLEIPLKSESSGNMDRWE
jgi:DNA polymerase-1